MKFTTSDIESYCCQRKSVTSFFAAYDALCEDGTATPVCQALDEVADISIPGKILYVCIYRLRQLFGCLTNFGAFSPLFWFKQFLKILFDLLYTMEIVLIFSLTQEVQQLFAIMPRICITMPSHTSRCNIFCLMIKHNYTPTLSLTRFGRLTSRKVREILLDP